MIAKIALLFAAVAAAQATLLSPVGIPTAVRTGTIVSIPGATTIDKRVIGTTGLVAGAPLLSTGLIGSPLIGSGLIGAPVLNSGLLGAPLLGKGLVGAPLLNSGLIAPGLIGAPIGLKGAPLLSSPLGLLGAPGMVKTIL